MHSTPSLRAVARGAAGIAAISGALGGLSLLGAFGPVSCWTSGSSAGEVTRGCESGIDFLLGSTTGNVPVLFFWAVALLGFAALGATAAWSGRRRVTWGLALVGVVVSVVGVMSVGWYFALPTLCLLLAATSLTVAARRNGRDDSVAA